MSNKPKPATIAAASARAAVAAIAPTTPNSAGEPPKPVETAKPVEIPKAKEQAETVKVRVTLAHGDHLPNHVLTLSLDDAQRAVDSRWADADPAGVAYAEENEPQPEPVIDEAKG